MTLKSSVANLLKAVRAKRNVTQRNFVDPTSRMHLSKLELGKWVLSQFLEASQQICKIVVTV
jgi:hypothetical protein